MRQVSEESVRDALIRATRERGSCTALATNLGFSIEYISRMRRGKDKIAPAVADRLGYEIRWSRNAKGFVFLEPEK